MWHPWTQNQSPLASRYRSVNVILFYFFSFSFQSYSLRSLLYLSYSLHPTSLMAYWLIVTVLPPIASFTTTLALSGSTPSICSTRTKGKGGSQRTQHIEMIRNCGICITAHSVYKNSRSVVPCHTGPYEPLTPPAHSPQDPSLVPPPSLAPRLAWGVACVWWAPGPLSLNDLLQDPNLLGGAGVQLASHLCRQGTSVVK